MISKQERIKADCTDDKSRSDMQKQQTIRTAECRLIYQTGRLFIREPVTNADFG